MLQTIVHPDVGKWLVKTFGTDFDIGDVKELGHYTSIGVVKDRKPLAGVAFTEYRKLKHGHDIRVTVGALPGTNWLSRSVLNDIFSIPFRQFGCARITAIISERNKRSQEFCKHLGFHREGVARRGFDGKTNAIIYGMLADECRWLKDSSHG